MNCVITAIILISLLVFSIFLANFIFKKGGSVKKALAVQILTFFLVPVICGTSAILKTNASYNNAETEISTVKQEESDPSKKGLGQIAMAIAILGGCIGTGIAVAAAAPAAIGATSENPNAFGKSLVFVALAEGVCIFALLIAILIYAGLNG